MLLLSKVRFYDKIGEAEAMRGRFERQWEAVRGRERPCSSHWLRDLGQRVPDLWHRSLSQWGEHGLSRPLTASQIGLSSPRPHRICHVICLSQSEESRGSRTSDSTGWGNAFSREISQIAPRIGLHRPVCVRGRSDSQICEADLWGRGSPSTASH